MPDQTHVCKVLPVPPGINAAEVVAAFHEAANGSDDPTPATGVQGVLLLRCRDHRDLTAEDYLLLAALDEVF